MRRHAIDTERTNGHGVICTCGQGFESAALLYEHAANAERDAGDGRDGRSSSRGAGCCKRVKLDDGRYGFCILPAGHEIPGKDAVTGNALPALADKCTAHVSTPPTPSTFKPKR